MLKKRLICALLLAALLMALPTGALAAKRRPSVKFPVKMGLVTVGDEVTLTPKVKRAAVADLVWESSDNRVISVDQTGNVIALVSGEALVQVRAPGGAIGAVLVRAEIPVESVSLSQTEALIPVGETFELTAAIYPENADNANVVWSSSVPEVASALFELEVKGLLTCNAGLYAKSKF